MPLADIWLSHQYKFCPTVLRRRYFPGDFFRGDYVQGDYVLDSWLCRWQLQHKRNILLLRRLLFTARAYAMAVLGVVILSVRLSVCPSVTRLDCDKTKWRTADIFIPHERATTLLLWYQEWLVGDTFFLLKSAFKVTHPPSKNADFDLFPLITSQP